MGRPTPDLTGQRFGRLLVIERAPRTGSTTHAQWICQCDCGESTTVNSSALRNGHTQSCGCLRRETTAARSTRHGLAPRKGKSPTYYSWAKMIQRCTNPADPRYPDWGGRGITVCPRWRDFSNFLADMGEKPDRRSQIDRIDNERGYEPGNARWSTADVQSRNKRNSRVTQETVLQVQALLAEGRNLGEISAALGLERHSVGLLALAIRTLT